MTAVEVAAELPNDRMLIQKIFDDVRLKINSEHKFMVHAYKAKSDQEAILNALSYAESDGWLPLFAQHCITHGLLADDIPTTTAVEGLVRAEMGYENPETLSQGIVRCMRIVGLVDIKGHSTGTGFLVGPQVIVTCWHLIAPLVDQYQRPIKNSGAKITIEFDKIADWNSKRFQATPNDWLVAGSLAHPHENTGLSASKASSSATNITGYLDYAVIKLTECPEREWVKFDSVQVPSKSFKPQLTLFQHPLAFKQRISTGEFKKFHSSSNKERILYSPNSDKGSSGGLVVNSEFEFIGLHQGSAVVNGSEDKLNVAILASAIRDDIIASCGLGCLNSPDPESVFHHRRLNNSGPIIGRTKLQPVIWDCYNGIRRIGVVSCDVDLQGKSFTSEIFRASLPSENNSITVLNGSDIPLMAEQAASLVLKKFCIDEHNLPLEEHSNTTTASYVRDELFPVLVNRFNETDETNGLLYWLILDCTDQDLVPGGSTQLLFERMCANITHINNFRLILIGWHGAIAGANHDIITFEEIEPPTVEDIQRYIRQQYIARSVQHGDGEIFRIAELVFRSGGRKIASLSKYIDSKFDRIIENCSPK